MTGIEDDDMPRGLSIEDLVVGKLYLGELIIDRTNTGLTNMTTLSREDNHIRVDYYVIKAEGGKVRRMLWNGGGQIEPSRENYDRFNSQLQEAEL